MTRPRDPRPRPEPMSPEEAAEIEAKYQDLAEWVARMRARRDERREYARQAESCEAEPA